MREVDNTPSGKISKFNKWLMESSRLLEKSTDEAKRIAEYDRGLQLSTDILSILNQRGQPPLHVNIITPIIDRMVDFLSMKRGDIKTVGRQQIDTPLASVVNDLIKSVQDKNRYAVVQKRCDRDLAIAGVCMVDCFIRKSKEKDVFGENYYDFVPKYGQWDEYYIDPYSSEEDYSDARYIHRPKWIDRDDMHKLFPEKAAEIELLSTEDYMPDDEQDEAYDFDSGEIHDERDRVLLTTTWYREYDPKTKDDVYRFAYWSGSTILQEGESPYDTEGFPVVVRKLRNGIVKEFYGMMRDVLPLQDAINFASIRIANMMGTVKVLYEDGAVEDDATFAMQYSRDNGLIKVKRGAISGGMFREISNAPDIQALAALIEGYKRSATEIIGFNEEFMAQDVRQMSGKAIEHRQAAGVLGTVGFMDVSKSRDMGVFKLFLDVMPRYYDQERILTITDATTMQAYQKTINVVPRDAAGRPMQGVIAKNDITIGEYDLVFSERPKTITNKEERFAEGMQYFQTIAQVAPGIAQKYLAMILKDSDYTDKDELIGMLSESQEQMVMQAIQQNPKLQQSVMQMMQQQQQLALPGEA